MRVRTRTGLDGGEGRAALLALHGTLRLVDLWAAAQRLFEVAAPYDSLTMSVNYLNWRDESSTCRFSSASEGKPHDEERDRALIGEGRSFFQPFLDANAGVKAYRHSQIIGDRRKIGRTALYRHYMRPNDWAYSAHLLYWKGGAVETSLALRRRKEQGDFGNGEMEALEELHGHLSVAFERIRSFEEERQRRFLLEGFYRRRPGAVLYFDWELRPVYTSHDARLLCAEVNLGAEAARRFSAHSVFRMPAALAEVCEGLREEWRGAALAPEEAGGRVKLERRVSFGGTGIEAEVMIRAERREALTKPVFEVRMQRMERVGAPPADEALERLTPAERELVGLVCGGLSNKEISRRLMKTEGTIKVQLSGIFRKLRLNSRTQLMAAMR